MPDASVIDVVTGDFDFNVWPSGYPYDWGQTAKGDNPHDNIDFHVDLGCGKIKKARIGVDHFKDPAVDIVWDLNRGELPFKDNQIRSMITHHCLEHIGDGFIPLMDECYRVLAPGALFRIIVPIFPSFSAVSDPDHRRYFMATDDPNGIGTFDAFCGTPGETSQNCWLASFSVPYTKARFKKVFQSVTPRSKDPHVWWTPEDAREMRLSLIAMK